jgi:3' terminal RNA ribose 2'-O-methyltransferase Hen1
LPLKLVLIITATCQPATDLGFLLHKNPGTIFRANLSFGRAMIFYPTAESDTTTAVLQLEIDPVKLVRGSGEASGPLDQYVNDRPYTANSYLSVAIADTLGSALNGRSRERQALAETPIPLEIRLPVLPCRGGSQQIRDLFGPVGWEVEAQPTPLDPENPGWGDSCNWDVTLTGVMTLSTALRSVYILVPSLDAKKHYFMGEAEVQKLLDKGEGWLAVHPAKDEIVSGFLGRRRALKDLALRQLASQDEALSPVAMEDESLEAPAPQAPRLHTLRRQRLKEIIESRRPTSLLDLGCGDGGFLKMLLPIRGLSRLAGMDISLLSLQRAVRKLGLETAGPALKERVQLFHGSLTYRDRRLEGYEVCTLVEVIEHLDPPRLEALEETVFGQARPEVILLTTPNRDYNQKYGLEGMRHSDHRFEWTRAEFQAWAEGVASRHGYKVRLEGIGEDDAECGAPSQLAEFSR